MLHRDHRPPTTRPADGEQAQPDQARGATAFQWQRSMVVDQAAHTAVMDGRVVIVRRADDPGTEPIRIDGDRATATFEAKRPATRPAGGRFSKDTADADPADAANAQLKWLTIDGNVTIVRGDATLTCDRLDYDPASGVMIAVGTPRVPATWQDAARTGFVDRVEWNTRTWLPRLTGFRGRMSAAPPPTPAAKPAPARPAATPAQPVPAQPPASQPAAQPQPTAQPQPQPAPQPTPAPVRRSPYPVPGRR
jgi:hypothetical protein